MGTFDVDVVVVGLGPGGEDLAGRLAAEGLAVVGVERHLTGGECPYYGCIPSKMIVRAADALAEGRRVDQLAGTRDRLAGLLAGRRRIRRGGHRRLERPGRRRPLDRQGSALRARHGRARRAGRVRVGDDTYVATRGIVLNVGTSPAVPPMPGWPNAARGPTATSCKLPRRRPR